MIGIRKAMSMSSGHINVDDNSGLGSSSGQGLMPTATRFSRKSGLTNSQKKQMAAHKFSRQRDKSDWQLLMSDWHVDSQDLKNNEEVRQKELDKRLKKEYYIRAEGPRA